MKWSQKTQDNFKMGEDEKQQMAQKIESKRLDKLNQLKALGGPFTDAGEVEDYLKLAVAAKKKKQRMKLELQFATVPPCCPRLILCSRFRSLFLLERGETRLHWSLALP